MAREKPNQISVRNETWEKLRKAKIASMAKGN